MVTYLKQLWHIPSFTDESENRIAHLLNLFFWGVGIAVTIYGLVLFLVATNYRNDLYLIGFIFLLLLYLRHQVVQRRLRWASFALVAGLWGTFTCAAFIFRGVHSPSFYAYVICILIAGLLIEPRAGFAVAGFSALAGLSMIVFPTGGATLSDSPTVSAILRWLWGSLIFGVVAAVQYAQTCNQIQTLARTRQHERALAESNRALLNRTAELEQSEVALRKSEAEQRALLRALPDMILHVHRNGDIIELKPPSNFAMFMAADQIVHHNIQQLLPGDFASHLMRINQQALEQGEVQIYEYDIQIDEEKHWREERVIPLSDDEVLVIVRDITRRKRAEAALRQSEERYRQLVELSPDAIFIHRNQLIVYANPAFLRLIGASALQQLIGKSLFDLVHPDYHQVVQERIVHLYAGKEVSLDEQKIIRLDGAILTVEVAAVAYQDQDGIAVQVIYRNVTERKEAELKNTQLLTEVVQQRVQLRALNTRFAKAEENERKRLAQELHDSVAQNLTGVNLNLNVIRTMITREVAADSRIHARLNDAIALVEQTTVQIRDSMASLRPPVLDDYGLLATLEWYANQISSRTGLAIDVLGEELTPRPTEYVELTLFRIAQEALSNVVKYSQATKATILLNFTAEIIHLNIIDNGHGFDVGLLAQAEQRQQWGLIAMRERAEAAGGRCKIQSTLGEGTTILVEVSR